MFNDGARGLKADPLGLRELPYLSRRNFLVEFQQFLPWSVVAGLVEGQFGSVVVARSFEGSPLLIAIATATPISAFITSLLWGMVCVGRPKIRLLTAFTAGATLLTGLAGAIPATEAGAVWFIAQMAAAQVLLTGVLTVRSAVWRANYPARVRGQITSRLQRIRFLTGAVAVMVAAAICDQNPSSYRFIYPIVGLCGLISVFLAPRMRVRRERAELEALAEEGEVPPPRRFLVEPLNLTALLPQGKVLRRMFSILRQDTHYARYCLAQSLMGVGNLMTTSVLATVVTNHLDFGQRWGFWISTVLIVALHQLTVLVSLGHWGRLFDALGVLRFRIVNVSCWALSLIFGMFATLVVSEQLAIGAVYLPLAVGLFAVRSVLAGLGRGGGALAWHIGHLHFANDHDAELYMGIHVSLTGIRGMLAPLIGIWLWHLIGWPVWGVATVLCVWSILIFRGLARREERKAESEAVPAA